jgi:hypothetical protein
MACKGPIVHPGCQQSASKPAWHGLTSHVLAIQASPVYLRRCDVEGRPRPGVDEGGEVFTRQRPQGSNLSPTRTNSGMGLSVVSADAWSTAFQLCLMTRR